jgi:hypothetical protein
VTSLPSNETEEIDSGSGVRVLVRDRQAASFAKVCSRIQRSVASRNQQHHIAHDAPNFHSRDAEPRRGFHLRIGL